MTFGSMVASSPVHSAKAPLQSATSVQIVLQEVEGDSTPGVVLIVGPTNGIVAVDDGGEWGGIADLALPFP